MCHTTQCQSNNCATISVLIDYIHSPHEEISAVILTSKKFDEIPFLSSPPGEKHDRAEKLREARLFAGMEMTVDFDLTRWNLITLRTGTCSSGIRNEACRRSRVSTTTWRFVTKSIGKVSLRKDPLDMYVSPAHIQRQPKEISLFLLDLISYVWRQTRRQTRLYLPDHVIQDNRLITDSAIRLDDLTVKITVYVC